MSRTNRRPLNERVIEAAEAALAVRFSRTRKRYERQGILVEPQALREAQAQIDKERRAS